MQEKLAVVCKFGLGDEFMCNKPMLWKENKSYYSFKLQFTIFDTSYFYSKMRS